MGVPQNARRGHPAGVVGRPACTTRTVGSSWSYSTGPQSRTEHLERASVLPRDYLVVVDRVPSVRRRRDYRHRRAPAVTVTMPTRSLPIGNTSVVALREVPARGRPQRDAEQPLVTVGQVVVDHLHRLVERARLGALRRGVLELSKAVRIRRNSVHRGPPRTRPARRRLGDRVGACVARIQSDTTCRSRSAQATRHLTGCVRTEPRTDRARGSGQPALVWTCSRLTPANR
jgi:hypothetical protein